MSIALNAMKFNRHIDPGHSWFEVPYDLIVDLGIENRISSCSYRQLGTCYLEEDCDAPLFIDAWMKHYGESEFPVESVRHDYWNSPECFVRELPSYYTD